MSIPQHVVLIAVDGLRPEALTPETMPVLSNLAAHGAVTHTAQTIVPSISLPCFTSLFYSVPPERHGTVTNTWNPMVEPFPGIMDLVKKAGKSAASFYSWNPLRDMSGPDAVFTLLYRHYNDPEKEATEKLLAEAAAETLEKDRPTFTFIYIEITDLIGHLHGWMSAPYLQSARRADDAIQLLVERLRAANQLGDTLLAVTADHGGHDHTHGSPTFEDTLPSDLTIPLVFYGPGVLPGSQMADPVSILDIAPTLAWRLGLEIPIEWQGRILKQAFQHDS